MRNIRKETISTTGVSYVSKIMEFKDYKKSIKYQILDTASQEKYRRLTKLVILVYDMTRRKSFDEIKNYW